MSRRPIRAEVAGRHLDAEAKMDVILWVLGLAGSAVFSWFFSRLYYQKALARQNREANEQIAKLRELADEHRAAEALELRLRLRNADVDYRRTVEDLRPLLERARASRAAVLAADGTLNSGAWQSFLRQLKEDQKAVEVMLLSLPPEASDYHGASNEDLEMKLVTLHDNQGRAETMREGYRAMLAWDDKEREQIRADQRSRTHGLLGH